MSNLHAEGQHVANRIREIVAAAGPNVLIDNVPFSVRMLGTTAEVWAMPKSPERTAMLDSTVARGQRGIAELIAHGLMAKTFKGKPGWHGVQAAARFDVRRLISEHAEALTNANRPRLTRAHKPRMMMTATVAMRRGLLPRAVPKGTADDGSTSVEPSVPSFSRSLDTTISDSRGTFSQTSRYAQQSSDKARENASLNASVSAHAAPNALNVTRSESREVPQRLVISTAMFVSPDADDSTRSYVDPYSVLGEQVRRFHDAMGTEPETCFVPSGTHILTKRPPWDQGGGMKTAKMLSILDSNGKISGGLFDQECSAIVVGGASLHGDSHVDRDALILREEQEREAAEARKAFEARADVFSPAKLLAAMAQDRERRASLSDKDGEN
jgi:hypothetical protein